MHCTGETSSDRLKLKAVPADEEIESVADDDDREPTKEEIMDDIRQGLRDLKAGYAGMPALESLDALENTIYGDADFS